MTGKRALVTGGSRGIGAAIAKALAAEGCNVAITYEQSADAAEEVVRAIAALGRQAHDVRTTVRTREQERELRVTLTGAGMQRGEALSFAQADLNRDEGWADAVDGCDQVLHVASPFPAGAPKDEAELIGPAREGTLRVLRAARDRGVRRVVMTSSFAAVGYGHPPGKTSFSEADWTDANAPGLGAYVRSKTLAERAAWDFVAQEGGPLELSVINPVGIFGPVLGKNLSASTLIIKRMLDGGMPACPRVYFGVVDVRDIATLHLLAMTHPAANGERFLGVAGDCVSMFDVAQILRRHLGLAANKVPSRQIPDWLLRIAALWDDGARQTVPNVGKVRNSSNAKARRLLGWQPRSNEEAVLATAQSLIRISDSSFQAERDTLAAADTK